MTLRSGEGVLDYMDDIFKSATPTDEAYTTWAPVYDESLRNIGTSPITSLAEEVMENIINIDSAELLDVAAGTGLCGEELLKANYKGKMDAIEPNESMLALAKAKGIYRNLYKFCLELGQHLPVDSKLYDAIIGSGCFVPHHVDPDCLLILIESLKPGGVIIFNHRHVGNTEYKASLDQVAENLVQAGKLKELKNEPVSYNDRGPDKPSLKWQHYIYKKI